MTRMERIQADFLSLPQMIRTIRVIQVPVTRTPIW
jgi:hypothetical protein